MTASDVFRRIVGALEQVGIPYMLTGSFAGSFHGAPRATQDIDIVVAPTQAQLRALVALLPPADYYVDEGAALQAQRDEGQFNIIDLATGWKVDLIVRKARQFSREEFDRREVVDFQGMPLAIATIEDVIIAKLEWAKLGQSQRQIDDSARLLRIRAGDLDREYLVRWIARLGLQEQWAAATRAADLR
ncbi:MAG TPA: hypothetical protein VFK39_16345 [Gemmatimonadaceae bacterium]|nr:hypothetical protein [Gemmatimonadaceae bacterium]